jgi:hypothetical protein
VTSPTSPAAGSAVAVATDAERALAERLALPVDLKANLDAFQANRAVVMTFIKDYLEEADYNAKGELVAGALGDYYKVPGSEQKALTKRGASKVKQLFRWSRGAARRVDGTQTREFCSATIEVPILDQYGRTVGAGIGAASTAEKRFTSSGSIKKYGGWCEWDKEKKVNVVTREPDYRAALHDVISIATKRADTQGTIVAAALEEIFQAAAEDDPPAPAGGPDKDPPPVYPGAPQGVRLPLRKFGQHGGALIAKVPTPDLCKIVDWMRDGKRSNPAVWTPYVDAISLELDARRQDDTGEEDLVL